MNELTDQWFSDDQATLGDRIAGARDAAGLDQKDLARHLGVRLETIQRWEDDLAEPRANRVGMLAGLLGVSLSWLLTGEGDGPDWPPEEMAASSDLTRLLDEVRLLQSQMNRNVSRLAMVEKALRRKMQETAA